MFAWKYQTYTYMQEHLNETFGAVCDARDPITGLKAICRVPGMGLVKGAFVLQMIGHDVACYDSRNLARDGYDRKHWELHGRQPTTAQCEAYVLATRGRAEELWDTWCTEVAADYLMTPEKISRMHVELIVPKPLRGLRMDVRIKTEEIPF